MNHHTSSTPARRQLRVGILTLPFNNNYGGYLQAYALQQILRDMGCIPTLIMRRANQTDVSAWFKIKFAMKGVLKSIIKRKKFPFIYETEDYFYHRGKNMFPFMEKQMGLRTSFLYSTEELLNECRDRFDAYVVGSDQVWRPDYVSQIENFFLDFTSGWNVLRVAYAASFGTDSPKYTDGQIDTCGRLVSFFDSVSVREYGGLDVIEHFGWKAKRKCMVLDPTMLLSVGVYQSLLPQSISSSHGKVLCYVLDERAETIEFSNKVCVMLNRDKLDFLDSKRKNEYHYVLPSVEDWLAAIRDADYVVTDSFHGTVFSIIFNKPYLVCVNKQRGADRFVSLLRMIGMEDRMVETSEELEQVMGKEIDWEKVNKLIAQQRNSSIDYLKKALNLVGLL